MLGKKKFHTTICMLKKLLKVWGLGGAWLPNTMAKWAARGTSTSVPGRDLE